MPTEKTLTSIVKTFNLEGRFLNKAQFQTGENVEILIELGILECLCPKYKVYTSGDNLLLIAKLN